jgi:hypothetical protein
MIFPNRLSGLENCTSRINEATILLVGRRAQNRIGKPALFIKTALDKVQNSEPSSSVCRPKSSPLYGPCDSHCRPGKIRGLNGNHNRPDIVALLIPHPDTSWPPDEQIPRSSCMTNQPLRDRHEKPME